MKTTYFFTFGSNHVDESGASLGSAFVPITIEGDALGGDGGHSAARAQMFAARGDKFAFQYTPEDFAGQREEYGLAERTLESVAFDKARMSREAAHERFTAQRRELENRLAKLDACEALAAKLPMPLIPKCTSYGAGMDLDNISREDVVEVLSILKAGRWEKTINATNPTLIDYTGEVDGLRVRLWGAAPPGTCRIVEVEEVIPTKTVITKKLICHE